VEHETLVMVGKNALKHKLSQLFEKPEDVTTHTNDCCRHAVDYPGSEHALPQRTPS
jgi:hypothetical protein